MARMEFSASDKFTLKLSKYSADSHTIIKQAIYAGANIAADAVKSNLEKVVSSEASGGLVDSLGITPISLGTDGNWSAKVGFDGYDDHPTPKYPKGIPYQLKARAMESGTSYRVAKPFVRPAVNKTRKQVVEKMNQTILEETDKLFK